VVVIVHVKIIIVVIMLLNEPPIFNEKIVIARIISIDRIIGIVVDAWRA